MRLQARDALAGPRLADLMTLDDAAFRALFSKSPVKRIGRDRFIRNVLYAVGNSADLSLIAHARKLLDDPAPVVRGAAVWALSRLMAPADFAALAASVSEPDPEVRREWESRSVAEGRSLSPPGLASG
jgi:epoxyqueuosine reductase